MAGRDGLFDEQSDAGELFQDLDLNISPLKGTASEHGWASDDDSLGLFLLGHRIDEFVQTLADPGVLVGGPNETVAFGLNDCGSTVGCGVYNGYDLQPRSKFTGRGRDEVENPPDRFHSLFETERVVPWALGGALNIGSGLYRKGGGILQTEHDISSTDEKDIEILISWSKGGPED